jgi:thioesterase domain-containing protein
METTDGGRSRALEALHDDIPLARALGIEIVRHGHDGVALTAPFDPNRNGHGTLFGGSAVSVALIAGWLLVHGWVEAAGIDADVVIHELDARFDTPITGNVRATAQAPPSRARERFERTLAKRGRARVDVPIRVGGGDVSKGTALVGRYVALRRAD